MGEASDDLPWTDSRLDEEVERAIAKLVSAREGDRGVIATVACGTRAVPALRAVLFEWESSGLYEPRRRAVEALASLRAYDTLIEYLQHPREVGDPVQRTGEDAVINAAARAIAESTDERVVPLLFELSRGNPLAGVVEALGKLYQIRALPYFIAALAEDFTRPAAEFAIRKLGGQTRDNLLDAAGPASSGDERESVSSRRKRRSALKLFAELGPAPTRHWARLDALLDDEETSVAVVACDICLGHGSAAGKRVAVRRLLELIDKADWLLVREIEDSLVAHFDAARPLIEIALQNTATEADSRFVETGIARALRRVMARIDQRAKSLGNHIRHGID
ncbi:MAG: hypothetical protein ACREFD_03505 [Stellaceae bacterium]